MIPAGIPAVYGDVDAREAALDDGARRAGGSVVEFGASVEGRKLRAAVVPSTSSQPSSGPSSQLPTVLVDANIHGVEWVGARAALGVLQALSDARGARLRQRAHVVVAPALNPDGAFRTQVQRGVGTVKELRTNKNGVDLNRNFPLPHGAQPSFWMASGSSSPSKATYRGSAAFSEPETRAVEALASEHKFHATISFHSFMGTLIPPKVTSWRDARAYRRLCRAFRRGQTRFFYPTFMCAPVDVFTGELEDHLHHVHHGWALTVEVFPLWRSLAQHLRAPSLFARFNPDEPQPFVDDAVAGALSCLDAALDLPRP